MQKITTSNPISARPATNPNSAQPALQQTSPQSPRSALQSGGHALTGLRQHQPGLPPVGSGPDLLDISAAIHEEIVQDSGRANRRRRQDGLADLHALRKPNSPPMSPPSSPGSQPTGADDLGL